jgi:hypothetical protein
MQHRLRRVEAGALQVRMIVQIPVLVETAGFDASDQAVEIEAGGSFGQKGGLAAVQH